MKLIFSRKGFDSAAGKASSPIIEGRPISLPIPTDRRSSTNYRAAGLGNIVEHMTNRRIRADHLCHEDPVFLNGRCAFGQTGAAQSHLERNRVGVGDIFLFFGLFALRDGRDRHHRIFGYLKVEQVHHLGSRPSKSDDPGGFLRRHPHTIGRWNKNNTIYLGRGAEARSAHPCLRLTKPDSPVSVWSVPEWLRAAGLTYHGNPTRWIGDTELRVASRGQEFVANIGNRAAPGKWLRTVVAAIHQQ